MKQYRYVGPTVIGKQAASSAPVSPIRSIADLRQFVGQIGGAYSRGNCTLTFVIDLEGLIRLADRHSEHVACTRGEDVLSAGEMTFRWTADHCDVLSVTNQSTGYCPESTSWDAVHHALTLIGLTPPANFDPQFCFRRCPSCQQINILKDNWFVCAVCDSELPA